MLTLSGCAAGGPDNSGGEGASDAGSPAPEKTVAAAPKTACPAGFVEAWGAAAAANFEPDLTFREATVDEFRPTVLAPFLDGGCAIFASGTSLYGGVGFVERYYGFSPDSGTLADVTSALDGAGYTVSDPSTPAFFKGPNGEYASAFPASGDVATDGDAAIRQYFPNGVVFY